MSIGDLPEFLQVTPSVWDAVQADIIQIEEESFPLPIRDSAEYLLALASSPTSIFLVLRIPSVSKIVGYIAADVLEKFTDVPGITSDPHFNEGKTIYIASVAIRPEWRRQGLGTALQKECLRRALEKGFKRAMAHVQSGAAARMGLEAQVLMSFENWYGTGQTFDYVEFSTSMGRWTMQPRWKDGCKGMLTVNAIFAGFSGVLLINLINLPDKSLISAQFAMGATILALVLFAWAAEWLTDALDESKVDVYLRSMAAYNFGVVCILLSVAAFLYNKTGSTFAWIPAVFIIYPWLSHALDLLFKDQAAYKTELLKTD